jgi:hypothetical protein
MSKGGDSKHPAKLTRFKEPRRPPLRYCVRSARIGLNVAALLAGK